MMFHNTTGDQAASFPNCSPMAFLKTSMLFPIFSSRGCCRLLRPPLLLAVALPFLRCRGSSVSPLLMPFLHSWPFHCLFSVRPHRVLRAMLSLVEYSLTKFPSCRTTPARRVMFLPRSTICLGPRFPEDVPLAPCHCCMAEHLPAGGSQLLGSTISSGQFLRLSTSPCRLLLAPMPLFPFFDRFHYGIFIRDLPMFRFRFQTCLRRSLAGYRPFSVIPQGVNCYIFARSLLPQINKTTTVRQ
jgi:hypothetical protein